ncbi:MAG: hypothetical protein AB7O97_16410 [Planctomycetota bacterium]
MSDPNRKGILGPILIAAAVSLAVTIVRLYGELQDWNPQLFGKGAGGGNALVGIAWLVIPFGFWFGRRLAQGGRRPRSTVRAIGFCVLGVALMFGLFAGAMAQDMMPRTKVAVAVFMGATVAFGLLAAAAWPAAWLALAGYGLLARIPVAVIQYLAFQDPGWQHTHYAKGPPPPAPQDPDHALFALTIAQLTIWPFAFTVLVGGLFAAIGAATVRRS